MKNTFILILTIMFVHSINAQVYYDQDTVFLTVEQAEELPQEIKPILYNNTPNEIKYKWRRTILQGPSDLWIVSEDQNFQAPIASSCNINLTNITSAGGFYPQIGIDIILSKEIIPDSLPWIIKFDVLRAPSCDSLYASVIYVVGDLSSSTEITSLNNVRLYPNPCHDYLTIDIDKDELYHGFIYDQMGQLVFQQKDLIGKFKFNTDALPIGMYVLKLENGIGNASYRRFVKE
jgi:hypothetical protein